MVNRQLLKLIVDGMATDTDAVTLRHALRESGWTDVQISDAFDEYDKNAATLDQIGLLSIELQDVWESIRLFGNRLSSVERSGPDFTSPINRTTPAPIYSKVPSRSSFSKWIDWEQALGGNWLTRIGALALVMGVGFFVALVIQNDWIGPTGQVVLSMLVGLILLFAGEYWQKKYPSWAQALAGAGVAILFTSIFAAVSVYGLIEPLWGLGFICFVLLTSAIFSVRYEAPVIAVIGISGGFIAPIILGWHDFQLYNELLLMGYVVLLDIGILALAILRNWRILIFLGLIGSLLVFTLWYVEMYDDNHFLLAEIYLSFIFMIFLGTTTLFHLLWKRSPQPMDLSLMVLNATTYFGMNSFLLLETHGQEWTAALAMFLAAIYVGVAYVALVIGRTTMGQQAQLGIFSVAIAVVFMAMAVPLAVGSNWVNSAWYFQAIALVWVGLRLGYYQIRFLGLILFGVATVSLVIFDTPVVIDDFRSVLNYRVMAYIVAIGTIYGAAYLFWRNKQELKESEKDVSLGLGAIANALTLWIISWEIWDFFSKWILDSIVEQRFQLVQNLENARNFSLSFVWMAYAVVLIVIGIAVRVRLVRLAGLGLLWIPILKVFLIDTFELDQGYRVAAYISLAIILLATGYLYQRFDRAIKGFLLD